VDAQHRQLNVASADKVPAGNQAIHFGLGSQPVIDRITQREATAFGKVEGRDGNVMVALLGAQCWFWCGRGLERCLGRRDFFLLQVFWRPLWRGWAPWQALELARVFQ
jgi:hypothetical protein